MVAARTSPPRQIFGRNTAWLVRRSPFAVRYAYELDSHRSAARQALAEVVLIFAIFFLHGAYPVPDSNEAHYLAKAKHYWNPDWAAGDFFLETANAHLVFYWTFGWLTRWLSLEQVAWMGRLLTWALLAVSWRRLSFAVVPRAWMSVLSATVFVGLNENAHMAGEWVVGGIEAKGFAYALVFFALERLARAVVHGVGAVGPSDAFARAGGRVGDDCRGRGLDWDSHRWTSQQCHRTSPGASGVGGNRPRGAQRLYGLFLERRCRTRNDCRGQPHLRLRAAVAPLDCNTGCAWIPDAAPPAAGGMATFGDFHRRQCRRSDRALVRGHDDRGLLAGTGVDDALAHTPTSSRRCLRCYLVSRVGRVRTSRRGDRAGADDQRPCGSPRSRGPLMAWRNDTAGRNRYTEPGRPLAVSRAVRTRRARHAAGRQERQLSRLARGLRLDRRAYRARRRCDCAARCGHSEVVHGTPRGRQLERRPTGCKVDRRMVAADAGATRDRKVRRSLASVAFRARRRGWPN